MALKGKLINSVAVNQIPVQFISILQRDQYLLIKAVFFKKKYKSTFETFTWLKMTEFLLKPI